MRSIGRRRSCDDDCGETMVSAVIGIALSVVALITLGTVLSVAITTESQIRSHTENEAELLRLDALLLTAAARVIQPLSLSELDLGIADAGIAYVDGDPKKTLSLRQDDDLLLSVVGETHRFATLRLDGVKVSTHPIPHLSVTVVDRAGMESVIIAPIGQVPIAAVISRRDHP